jgi:two-component system chemotaxis response regulator CheY
MHVLIVDDSRAMRMMIRRTLRQAGFNPEVVDEAEHGVEALAKVKEKCPDLILSDWNMPELDGIGLLEKVKEAGFNVPVGFITAQFTAEMRDRALGSGASFLITKPFTAEVFAETLKPYFF